MTADELEWASEWDCEDSNRYQDDCERRGVPRRPGTTAPADKLGPAFPQVTGRKRRLPSPLIFSLNGASRRVVMVHHRPDPRRRCHPPFPRRRPPEE